MSCAHVRLVVESGEQTPPLRSPRIHLLAPTKSRFQRTRAMNWISNFLIAAWMTLLMGCVAWGQNATSPGDAQALTLASKAVAALTGGMAVQDVTLTGVVTRDVGGVESGSAILRAQGNGESRIDLTLPDGTRTEIRDTSTGSPQGKWVNPDGKSGMVASHNTLTDSAWFFPALGALAGGSDVALSYIGQENLNGTVVQHIQSHLIQSSQATNATVQRLSTMDFYLDAATFLPVALKFNEHPDNDDLVNLAVEVDFSNFEITNGAAVPMRIQRRLQGRLVEDIRVSNVSFNRGLSISDFAVN